MSALPDQGPATSVELASRTGADERYLREWLQQQADIENDFWRFYRLHPSA